MATFLVHDSWTALAQATSLSQAAPAIVAAATGVLLFVGLWTPAAGLLAVLLELWAALSLPAQFWTSVPAAGLAAGLVLVGPGAWSLAS